MQDYTLFGLRAVSNLFAPPIYWADFLIQADIIGVGSATIVIFAGVFTGRGAGGAVGGHAGGIWGHAVTGRFVSMSMIRELGAVLTGIMVSGRNASSMASELGSMVVTEQIDAMRALGVDPMRKLVTPRIVATVTMLFFLTIVSDFCGILGGAAVTVFMNHQNGTQYFSQAYEFLRFPDILQGLLKPLYLRLHHRLSGMLLRHAHNRAGPREWAAPRLPRWCFASVLIIFVDLLISTMMVSIFR